MPNTPRLRGRALMERNSLFLADYPLCASCLKQGDVAQAEEVDHIIPLHKQGPDEWENLQGLCKPCHQEKTNRDKGSSKTGCDEQGFPLNRHHHWFQK
jgi:5-methylcytosine-specific restriction protein A